MFPQLLNGFPGDIYEGKIAITPYIHGHLIKGLVGDIYSGKIMMTPRIDGTLVREHVHFEKTLSDGFVATDYSLHRENTRYALATNTNQGLP